jgi:nucleotide-binding universal stress UspA family protein
MTNVVACIDGSSTSPAVCEYASWASQRLDAPLQFLHVLDKTGTPAQTNLSGSIGLGSREALLSELTELDEKRGKILLEHGRHMLEAAKEIAVNKGVSQITCKQRRGDLVDTLKELEPEIRLLVMGKQGEDGDSLGDHIGNNLERVVRTMHRPILVSPHDFRQPQSFMIAYDGSATTRKGIEMVAGSPLFKGLPCHIVMVGAATNDMHVHLDWARKILEAAGYEVTTEIIAGEVKQVLCDYRDRHDIGMVVMGAYGHSKIRQFLVGSTTTKMIQHTSKVSLLLLR